MTKKYNGKEECVCPRCGMKVEHEKGKKSCSDLNCPNCSTSLEKK